MRSRVLAALLLIVAPILFAEEWTPTRAFRTFSKSNWRGLPQSSVMALAHSNDGLLWIGTLDGVASFDGRSITPVPAVDGAPLRGIITSIIGRNKGGVYVASSAGVHVFDGTSWHLVPTKRGSASIAESRDGVLWLVDGGGGLFTLDANDTWHQRKEIAAPAVEVSAARDGAMWVATDTTAFRIFDGHVDAVGGTPLPSRPGAMLVASDGLVWIATQSCTVHWSRGGADGWHQVAFTPWSRGAFRCLGEDRRGRIWAGSAGGHVAFGNANMPWTVWGVANGPFEAGVMSVFGDREGSVWFGLNAVGLVQWIGEAWSHRPMSDPSNPSRALFSAFGLGRPADARGLLVSAFNTGALHLNADGTVRRYGEADGLSEDVRAFIEPEPQHYVAGTRFGIFESRNGQPFHQTLKLANGFVMGFFKSPDGRWYAATSTDGVYVRDGDTWQPDANINTHLENKHVRSMMWRANGDLWIATMRGITIFRNGVFGGQLTSRNERAIPESVNALLEPVDDEIWAAGTGGIAIRKNGKWTRVTDADGIPGQTIYSLARARDGAIWAGGSAGVGKFANGKWTIWDSREGLLQEECNLNGLIIDDDGSVYVSTMSGLARFDPSVRTLSPPQLALTWRNGTSPPTAAHERALHLRWSAQWLGPRPVQYRVRVPRLHKEWSPVTTEDHLDVENLSAGNWRVEVEARVEGTNEWSKPLTLDVDVAPFWYETWPARIAFIALLALIVYAITRLRLRALRRHAAMLEEVVRERTAELRESEQRAHAASRAKSAFLANMSHELRTPLNGVLGFAQLMARREHRDAEDQQSLAVIMSSGEHLLGLINNVLSLSKIEAGRITLEESQFDLVNVVRDVENVLRLRAEEKGLRFTTTSDGVPHAVVGDEMRVRQILLNLIGNAVKFTESGDVSVRVTWNDGRARFEVDDTGPGIGADELPKLFEPFVQSESGQRTREGTGLGLALSRNLARLMNGDITVTSTRGVGSKFVAEIELPIAIVEKDASAEGRVAHIAPEFTGTRILVVDDTKLNRVVLTTLLSKVGFDVREASNGEEALALWREWKPQLIWMDKRMPGMDGLEVTRRIRAEEKEGRTPILALSASALDHERGEILAAGCDDFVAKPFREKVILAKIREHVGVQYVCEVTPSTNGGNNVLLVDDDWICREVASEILRGNGVDVTTASSGTQALEILKKSRFDLVLMDLHMPDMGGVETTRRIRANPGTARIPIIAMSADTFDGDLSKTGMNDHVLKPVEPTSLTAVVKRWLV